MFSLCAHFLGIQTSHARGVRTEPVHSAMESVVGSPPRSGSLLKCDGGCFHARGQSLLREHLFDQRRGTCSATLIPFVVSYRAAHEHVNVLISMHLAKTAHQDEQDSELLQFAAVLSPAGGSFSARLHAANSLQASFCDNDLFIFFALQLITSFHFLTTKCKFGTLRVRILFEKKKHLADLLGRGGNWSVSLC